MQDDIETKKNEVKLNIEQGPVSSSVEKVLQKNRIAVQSYHSRSFTGNHCHKYLTTKTNNEICDHVVKECEKVLFECNVSEEKAGKMKEKAKNISEKFRKLNSKYAKVHESVSHCLPIADEEVNDIVQYISDYLMFYREKFENQSIPKQHFLEVHLVEWIRKWHVGLRLHGEQGGEHVHAMFNSLKHSMRGVHQPLMNLRCTMREHHVRVSPNVTSSFPKQKRRKLFE